MYDRIEEIESQLITARAKKQAIEAEKLTGDNIYKVLIYFEKLYALMNEVERRQLIEALILEIQIYEERQPNGQSSCGNRSLTFCELISPLERRITVSTCLSLSNR